MASADEDRLPAASTAVHETLEAFDRACSHHRPDSELSAVNRAAGRSVAIGSLLSEALATALDAAALTGGAVDPTVGGAMLALGFTAAPDEERGVLAERVPGWQSVELDAGRGRVRIPPGARLDLGATAKALAADQAAARASLAAGCGVLVSLLGDLAIAGRAPAGGWPVRVAEDHRAPPDADGQTVLLHDGGLATSSRTVRRLAGSPERHHLIDPRTGRPARSPWRTVTVQAASCLEANIVSTALLTGGAPLSWLLDEGELSARLVRADGTVEHRHRWPAEGEGA